MYEPLEDSMMLAKWSRELSFGRVLDMGTGSGILAWNAANNPKVKSVLAVDIDKDALVFARKNSKHKKITYKQSDLFKNVSGKFDTIIFNPPYLPYEDDIPNVALYGGKHGYELIEKFIPPAVEHLSGQLLLLFSSLTKKDKVNEILEKHLLDFELLEEQSFFFEKLFVYKVVKSRLREELEAKKIEDIKYLAIGHRGVVFTGNYKGKKVAIKTKRGSSTADTMQNEVDMLQRVNKDGIGPKYLFSAKDYVVYEFVEGKPLGEDDISKKVAINVMEQCRKLDNMHITKEEMMRPHKHIIIGKKVVLIDFERARIHLKPQNVTQFAEFLRRHGYKVAELAQQYKNTYSEADFKKIMHEIRSGKPQLKLRDSYVEKLKKIHKKGKFIHFDSIHELKKSIKNA